MTFISLRAGGYLAKAGGGGGVASISLALSDSTHDVGDSVDITATASNFTPTSYIFDIEGFDGDRFTVVQASNVYSWTVNTEGDFTIYVSATDGSSTAYSSISGSVNVETEATALISALETAYGGSLGSTQARCIDVFFKGIKGHLFSNPIDISSSFTGPAKVFLRVPQNDTTASVAAYAIEALSAAAATAVNYVSGDATVNGMTGGTGKYISAGVYSDDFSATSMTMGYMARSLSGFNGHEIGNTEHWLASCFGGSSTLGLRIINLATNDILPRLLNEGADPYSKSIFFAQSRSATAERVVMYNGVSPKIYTTSSGVSPTHNEIYFGAANGVGSSTATNVFSFVALGMTNAKLNYLYTVVKWFNNNIITGGRLLNLP